MTISDTPLSVDVRVLYTEGCSATPATVELINSVAAEMEIQISLRSIRVERPEQACGLQFLGSPTVQVNGLDIDPAARKDVDYGFM
jgi:hypothetical protein